MIRAGIYLRVSTLEQAEHGFSLDAQLDRLRSYCSVRDWEVAKEYIDDGFSGRNTKRPAYQEMMDEKDLWDVILVTRMDRIHRNSRNFMEMMDNLHDWDKNFTSINESIDTSSVMGKFITDILSRINQLESEVLGERVYEGLKQKVRSCAGRCGGHAPYGYSYGQHGELTINQSEKRIVRLIFKRYVQGFSTTLIGEELDKKGIKTQKGGCWSARTIGKILKNPIYAGYLKWDGIIYKDEHEHVISVKRFNEVQRQILRNTRNTNLKREPAIIK